MNDAQIKHMVNRFLSWKLPNDFRPDAGISFKAEFNEHTAHPMKHEPSGTNLFNADQAETMVRHLLEGLPPQEHVAPVRLKPLEWKTLVCSDRHAEVADSVLGRWEMWSFPNGSTHIMKPGEHQGSVYEDTAEEAKAYLERVYRRRMAPALATTEGSTDVDS